ncbi:hypothetical protein BH10PSE17_BH10PSE17_00870 [soil metagenome]
MKQAMQSARASLDEFLEKARRHGPELGGFAVKVGISEGNRVEYFWITPFQQDGDRFTGTIANEAEMVKTVRLGQSYSFAKARIVDWFYIDKPHRKMIGNATLCALLTKGPNPDAETTKRQFNLDCPGDKR